MVIYFFLTWLVLNNGTTIVAAPSFTDPMECQVAVIDPGYVLNHIQIPKDQIKAVNQWTDSCESVRLDLSKDAVI